jgi:6-phosphofructokinase 1
MPTTLAPKTIDNDLGLNYRTEPDEWTRDPCDSAPGYRYVRHRSTTPFDLNEMVNYVTPGFATAIYVTAEGVRRIRTTAESHRRIAIVEVMGRHSGYLALGTAYGQPDIILLPETRLNIDRLVDQVVVHYELQKNVVIACAEGIVNEHGRELGAETASTDPAGNVVLSGAGEALRRILIERLGDTYFTSKRRNESAKAAIFVRKVGHTQRGGRPLLFDRFYGQQLGGQAVDLLLEGRINAVSILQYNPDRGFYVDGIDGNDFRDRWGHIHARKVHPAFLDPDEMRPSTIGINYLMPIFTDAIGLDDMESMRQTLFNPGNLTRKFHSVNTDVNKRIRYLSGRD